MPEVVGEAARIGDSHVRLIRGDITDLDVQAFVFYAKPDLKLGSGFGTAISVRGGPSIQKELDEFDMPVSKGIQGGPDQNRFPSARQKRLEEIPPFFFTV